MPIADTCLATNDASLSRTSISPTKSTLYLKMKKYAFAPVVHEVRLCAS